MNRVRSGRQAEAFVARYYQRTLGFELLHQNLRLGPYEIDLLMRNGQELRIIEVRSSAIRNSQDLAWSLVGKKARSLRKAIHALLRRGLLDSRQPFQVDAALVRWSRNGPPSMRLWFDILPADHGAA